MDTESIKDIIGGIVLGCMMIGCLYLAFLI